MARASFGNTWWGEQWLEALAKVDNDNRLPRGRRYANNGSVKSLDVKDSGINAKVRGSQPRPYSVTIDVPPIATKIAAKLIDRVAQDPALIAKLLNRELDPQLLSLAKELGISIFPSSWKDLKMHCSCPDSAVPCKHLAAVIYLLSREIDSNPFLVFSLRGLDLTAALKARNIHIADQVATTLPTIAKLLTSTDMPSAGATSAVSVAPAEPASENRQAILDSLDFSVLPHLADALLQVLPANPTFYPVGDFREIYGRQMARIAKGAQKALQALPIEPDDLSEGLSPKDHPVLELNNRLEVVLTGASNSAWPEWLSALGALRPNALPDYQPEVAAFYTIRLLALHLLARGAVVPQAYMLDKGEVGVCWLPAALDATVSAVLAQAQEGLTSGLVKVRTGKKLQHLSAASQVTMLCSLFLHHYIRELGDLGRERYDSDKVRDLFFQLKLQTFSGPGEGGVAAGIHTWLARFHLAHREFSPVLLLDEGGRDAAYFNLALAAERTVSALERPVPLATVLTDTAWEQSRFGILQTASLLTEFFPPLNNYISKGAKTPVKIAAQELATFLFDALPAIRLLGIRTLLPKGLDHLVRPKLSMRVKGTKGASSGFLSADSIFDFNWEVAVGDHVLTREEFEKLVTNAIGVIRFKGSFVYLDPAEMERLRGQLLKPPSLTQADVMRVALAGEYAGAPIGLDAQAKRILRELLETKEVPLPKGLHAELRPYQQRGFAWLYRNAKLGLGSVIADDMGLGKTVQVIATLQKLKEEGHLSETKVLVVMPTSLLTNWQKEIARFAPKLSVAVFHGIKRELAQYSGENRPDVLLTTYGVARAEAAKLRVLSWCVVIVDEAQNIKNPGTAQTKAVKSIPAKTFIAVSGTPVENRLSEYWSIMDFANRGFLGSLPHFTKEYATPIQTDRDQQVLARFKRVTTPFLLRRLKSDKSIIADLPDKIEQNQYCSLSKEQVALYESVVREGLGSIEGESDTFKRQGQVLQMIMALKQICNHPAQYLKNGAAEIAFSGKAERFIELMDDIHANHRKALVFTQYRQMGDILSTWLQQRYGQEPLFLHGGKSRVQRDAMVDRFQNDRTERAFLLSLKAGGTGLNLTAADTVIHYDLWWNPAVEAQATDRAYRIGQKQNVQVHRMIVKGTFEERIDDMIQAKRELADLTVGVGETWVGNLSNQELENLFTLSA